MAFVILACSHRLRKLDPEEEDDPFNNYEVQAEAKLESCSSAGPHRLSFDSATFMESGRNGQCEQALLGTISQQPVTCPAGVCSARSSGVSHKSW